MALSGKTKKWLIENCNCDFNRKTVLITGATSGVGLKSAEIMVYLKAKVIMACRNEEKATAVKERFLKEYPDAEIDIIKLDLADFSSVDLFCKELENRQTDIDVFLNNAGVFHKPGEKTADGFDLVLGTNYLGVYYLTEKLLPVLSQLPHKVLYINTISLIHKFANIGYNDFFYEKRYSNFGGYGRSKLCLAKYTFYKANEYKYSNVKILMSHPGIAITPLGVNAFSRTVGFFAKLLKYVFNSPEKSALSLPFIMSHDLPAGSLVGPQKFFGGWGYPEICRLADRAKAGAKQLISFTKNIIE